MIMEILWPKSRGVFSKVLLKTVILSRPCCRTPFIFYLTLRIFSLGKHVTKSTDTAINMFANLKILQSNSRFNRTLHKEELGKSYWFCCHYMAYDK